MKTILLVGDSLTQRGFQIKEAGWVSLLADYLSGKADIINRGFSGYNTEWFKRILPRHDFKQDLSVLFFGANDASLLKENPHQHVPLDKYYENLLEMTQQLKQKGPVILITPPPMFEQDWLDYQRSQGKSLDRSLETVQKYREQCIKVAKQTQSHLLDTWTFIEAQRSFFVDGLHFSHDANLKLFEHLKLLLERELKAFTPQEIKPSLEVGKIQETSNFTVDQPLILCLGDSLTRRGFEVQTSGWVSQLQDHYIRKADVINKGFDFCSTSQLKTLLPSIFDRCTPSLSILMIGTNDMFNTKEPMSVQLVQYKQSLAEMVGRLSSTGPVILITPPPFYEPEFAEYMDCFRGLEAYRNACLEVGAQLQVPTLDAWPLMTTNGLTDDSYFSDGTHLNSKGNNILFKGLQGLIEERLPNWKPDAMALKYPWWDQVVVDQL
ncbi:SGNH hydrolase-type esterase domain-containing protein [Gorgonomyces haynaldii]|nr:SGNH hydrolase-type esterase domain-containing protein [Gorgonomyces haynaldii]